LPDIKRVLKHLPSQRQTLFFSATMPAPIVALTRELLRDPATINLARQAAPAVGITQAVYPVSQDLKCALFAALLKRGVMTQALVFTRTKHRADRLTAYLEKQGVKAARIHGNRSQAQRTLALSGFKSGEYPVLVATDIAARGIDVSELGHVVNFDVPVAAEDYIHRVGRTGRAEATGEAFTFVSREEEGEWGQIEKVVGKRLPRVQLPDFDYEARPDVRLEIPLAERIAAIRQRKAEERARAKAKAEARAARLPGSVRGQSTGPVVRPGSGRPSGHGSSGSGAGKTAPAMHARPHGAAGGGSRPPGSGRPAGQGSGRPGGPAGGGGRPGGGGSRRPGGARRGPR
jgi:ATP-dependent RNA helicase RhlE